MTQKENIISQVVATHLAWYPAHNKGRQAPEAAKIAWINKLKYRSLDESQLILLWVTTRDEMIIS